MTSDRKRGGIGRAGGDADLNEEHGSFVNEDRVRFLGPENCDAAADVAGERLHVFERSHFGFAPTSETRQFFEVECGVAGDADVPFRKVPAKIQPVAWPGMPRP